MTAAVLLPAGFVAFGAEWFFLAEADGLDAARADAGRDQRTLDRSGALVAQSNVVFGRAPLVAVPLNREIHVGMLAEELHIGLHRTLLVAADVRPVVVEIDILHVLAEQVLIRNRGRRCRRWRRLRHGDSRAGLLGSARAFRGQVIGGG